MKKTCAPQSAPACHSIGEGGFFSVRLLIGLFIVLASVFLALLGLGTFPAASIAQAQPNYIINNSTEPLVPPGFDCSKIHELGVDKQDNMRAGAIMIFCGEAEGVHPPLAAPSLSLFATCCRSRCSSAVPMLMSSSLTPPIPK